MNVRFGPDLRQPDQLSCGASCVVAARLLRSGSTPSAAGFRREALATHRLLTRATTPTGAMQLPWPRALGTPPWAVRSALAFLTGVPYRVRHARFDAALAATPQRPVAIFVGSRWLPRHVILAIGSDDGQVRAYDPASGSTTRITQQDWGSATLAISGWTRPWWTISPR
jgi:hypothetical protein